MSYKGKYTPKFPEKYKGNPCSIIYRSLWEKKFMEFCDTNKKILEWASEEFFIWYKSPIDNKPHKYFPDFYIKMKTDDGQIKKYVIEVKPKSQTEEPKPKKKKTKGYIFEVTEYAKNQAKWKAAQEFCEDRQWEFKVITEKELYGF